MSIKLLILHSSEIVRRGLETIIRRHFQIEITDASEISFLHHGSFENDCLLVLVEDSFLNNNQFEKSLRNACKKFELIKISHDDSVVENSKSISLHSGSSQLVKILKNILDRISGSENGEHEGEELTQREQEVLKLVALGFPNKIIADKLFISIHTVISHRKNITEKLGIKSISGLTVYAVVNGFIDTSKINIEDLF